MRKSLEASGWKMKEITANCRRVFIYPREKRSLRVGIKLTPYFFFFIIISRGCDIAKRLLALRLKSRANETRQLTMLSFVRRRHKEIGESARNNRETTKKKREENEKQGRTHWEWKKKQLLLFGSCPFFFKKMTRPSPKVPRPAAVKRKPFLIKSFRQQVLQVSFCFCFPIPRCFTFLSR